VVNVQQGSLRPLKQQIGTMLVGLVQLAGNIGHHGLEQFGLFHGLGVDRLELHPTVGQVRLQGIAKNELPRPQKTRQHMVVQCEQFAQPGREALGVLQILHAKCAPRDLVFVGRADAATCGADLFAAALLPCRFPGHIQRGVERQNQRTRFADAQTGSNFNTGLLQPGNLFEKLANRQHHTVADVAPDARAHDAAGNQVKGGLDAVDDQGVAGIVSALEAHDALRAFGQPIHQFAFALVAPLGADDNDISSFGCCHEFRS